MIKLKGLETVNAGFAKAIKKTEQLSMAGMIKGAILVRNSMEKQSPKIPVLTNNLRYSFFIVTAKTTKSDPQFKGDDASQMTSDHSAAITEMKGKATAIPKPLLMMGFSARYAAAVHEGIAKGGGEMDYSTPYKVKGKTIKRRPGAGAKFFESALDRNKAAIILLMKGELQTL